MTEVRDTYKCALCKQVVEVTAEGAPTLVCCGQPMDKLEPKTADSTTEKHVPVIEATEGGVLVKVGSVEHPMTDEHYIKYIEVLTADKVLRAELKPGMNPEAVFNISKDEVVAAKEYCTVHNLWIN